MTAGASAAIVSQHISTAMGPGRPPAASRNALLTSCDAVVDDSIRNASLMSVRSVAALIRELVQVTPAATDERRWNLARQTHYRRAVAHRRAQRRCGVQDAGPWYDCEHSRPTRRFGVAHCHVRGGLLVPRHDDLHVRAVQRIEQRIDLRAGYAEERRHAVGTRRFDDGFAAGQ